MHIKSNLDLLTNFAEDDNVVPNINIKAKMGEFNTLLDMAASKIIVKIK